MAARRPRSRAPVARPARAAYQELEVRFRRLGMLSGVQAMLDWDSATLMPPGGAAVRTDQLALLAAQTHRELTDPAVAALAERAARARLTPAQSANLAGMGYYLRHARAVPDDLVEALGRASARCEVAWRAAKPANDFKGLRPHLTQVLALVREKAAAKAAAFGCSPYDALLDQFNHGITAAHIDPVLDRLARDLPPLVHEAMSAQARRPRPRKPAGAVPAPLQQSLGREVATRMGFDFTGGRLDESAHPFTGGVPGDVRITSRPLPNDFLSGLMAVIHETGHALYEQGLPARWRWQPSGEAAGSAMHEAQALLWEMQVGRGRAFLGALVPGVRRAFRRSGPAFTAANIVGLAQRVRPGFIRVDADEVTYPLHVVLRYRLEKALVSGDLVMGDLPGAWADGMKSLLGVVPRTDTEGCLQDIHWTFGNYGYFPSYALGAAAAAQLFRAAARADRSIRLRLRQGDGGPLLAWLRTNIHAHGSRYAAPELLRRATGRGFDAEALLQHLRARYVDGRD